MRRISGLALAMVPIFAAGMLVGHAGRRDYKEIAALASPHQMFQLSAKGDLAELQKGLTARVIFDDPDKIKRVAGSGIYAYQTKDADDMCELHLPPMKVEYDRAGGRASFVDYYDSYTVAHELLHCALGSWHEDWGAVQIRLQMHNRPAPPFLVEPIARLDWLQDQMLKQFFCGHTPHLTKGDRDGNADMRRERP